MKEIVQQSIKDSIETKKKILETLGDQILAGGLMIAHTLRSGGKVLFCGNGGSSCDAAHIAAELVVRYKSGNERKALPAIALGTDSAILTACSNDYGYQDVFSRQVEAYGRKGDLLVGITTSGNSGNVIQAIQTAKTLGLKVISLLGGSGGKALGLADLDILVPSPVTARIQEAHILIGHIFCSIVEKELFGLD